MVKHARWERNVFRRSVNKVTAAMKLAVVLLVRMVQAN